MRLQWLECMPKEKADHDSQVVQLQDKGCEAMGIGAMRRKYLQWVIQQNPVEVTIKRTEKTKAAGRLEETITEAGPFTVRIFAAKSTSPEKITTLAGERLVDRSYEMLATSQADMQASSIVKDEFEAFGMHFIVKTVYPQIVHSEVIGYRCELERVT
jgi:hypothetical protein